MEMVFYFFAQGQNKEQVGEERCVCVLQVPEEAWDISFLLLLKEDFKYDDSFCKGR